MYNVNSCLLAVLLWQVKVRDKIVFKQMKPKQYWTYKTIFKTEELAINITAMMINSDD